MKKFIGAIAIALAGCGGGGSTASNDFWHAAFETNMTGKQTVAFDCGVEFNTQSQCESEDAIKACMSKYPFPPVPSNWTYVCTHTTIN